MTSDPVPNAAVLQSQAEENTIRADLSTCESDTESHNPTMSLDISRRSESTTRSVEHPPTSTEQLHEGDTHHFTIRSVLVGLVVGTVICFANTYFALQTGWISGMAMPAALIGFGFFKTVERELRFPFSPVENVLVQTVAGAVGTMPLGCGFVGVIPALEYLLRADENGPLRLSLIKLMIWAVGVCFFGVVFAVPLRAQFVIREKLKFPSGTATALMIRVLHRQEHDQQEVHSDLRHRRKISAPAQSSRAQSIDPAQLDNVEGRSAPEETMPQWKSSMRLLLTAFCASAAYTVFSYFVPQVRKVPIFGLALANDWVWAFNPSPAYIGQGIIMGPATTLHMLFGAVLGWGLLSPLAKRRSWAPGPVDDWTTGSKGWIVWISLAIMLADSVISLGWLLVQQCSSGISRVHELASKHGYSSKNWANWVPFVKVRRLVRRSEYSLLTTPSPAEWRDLDGHAVADTHEEQGIIPDRHMMSDRTTTVLFALSIALCIACVKYIFPPIALWTLFLAVILALVLGAMGVRAQGETDLNPVSGISKLTQLLFALVVPFSNPNAMTINLLAGAISESGALQAGDMMQDLKTGHLLGAAPKAQFWGQMIGSFFGAVISALVYRLYTKVYEIPGDIFQVPTAYVWIFTARLVTGDGLPYMAWPWALGFGLVFAAITMLRIRLHGSLWQGCLPSGIAVAVGMYNVPSFTLARTLGGLLSWYWRVHKGRSDTPIIVFASGLILGEGLLSILNLLLASIHVPHL